MYEEDKEKFLDELDKLEDEYVQFLKVTNELNKKMREVYNEYFEHRNAFVDKYKSNDNYYADMIDPKYDTLSIREHLLDK